jgi:hypothetical protein
VVEESEALLDLSHSRWQVRTWIVPEEQKTKQTKKSPSLVYVWWRQNEVQEKGFQLLPPDLGEEEGKVGEGK